MTEPLSAWIGRQERLHDVVDPWRMRALAATVAEAADVAPGAVVSPLWLWTCFLPVGPMSAVGPDGHPKRGGFLPPVPLPRRMWAGSRCRFHDVARVGDAVERVSVIERIEEKTGKAGVMVFVTVRHETRAAGRLVVEEEQDLVYLAIPDRFEPPPAQAPPAADWTETIAVDPVLLFRFSALTFNGHRIHYDRTYATEVERYPGLVVHGPLQAVLLHDAAVRHAGGRTPATFDFRGVRPAFDFDALTLGGAARADGGMDLFAAAPGALTMRAGMTFRP